MLCDIMALKQENLNCDFDHIVENGIFLGCEANVMFHNL